MILMRVCYIYVYTCGLSLYTHTRISVSLTHADVHTYAPTYKQNVSTHTLITMCGSIYTLIYVFQHIYTCILYIFLYMLTHISMHVQRYNIEFFLSLI